MLTSWVIVTNTAPIHLRLDPEPTLVLRAACQLLFLQISPAPGCSAGICPDRNIQQSSGVNQLQNDLFRHLPTLVTLESIAWLITGACSVRFSCWSRHLCTCPSSHSLPLLLLPWEPYPWPQLLSKQIHLRPVFVPFTPKLSEIRPFLKPWDFTNQHTWIKLFLSPCIYFFMSPHTQIGEQT